VDEYDAMLDGSPASLRALANRISSADPLVTVSVEPSGATVVRRRTRASSLRVTVEAGPSLLLEGNTDAIEIITEAMTGVAEEADRLGSAPIRRHVHIEYFGPGDEWRTPTPFR
jgi:hypothetical protein